MIDKHRTRGIFIFTILAKETAGEELKPMPMVRREGDYDGKRRL
jgi:hypothetical protein